jgi:hypothetical protein
MSKLKTTSRRQSLPPPLRVDAALPWQPVSEVRQMVQGELGYNSVHWGGMLIGSEILHKELYVLLSS